MPRNLCQLAELAFAICVFALQTTAAPAQTDISATTVPVDRVAYSILPHEADPTITRFDDANIVYFNRGLGGHPQLVVFIPGTDGKPIGARFLLNVVANLGYRVIGLEYNDNPAVVPVCLRIPYPECSSEFRERRIFG